jgi:hypothetical protein
MPATSAAYRGHGPLLRHIIWNVIFNNHYNHIFMFENRNEYLPAKGKHKVRPCEFIFIANWNHNKKTAGLHGAAA